MAVGKSSIQRVKAATGSAQEDAVKAVAPVEEKPVKKVEPKKTETNKTEVKKASAKKTTEQAATKKTAAVTKKPATVKKDDIHEKKFEMIDGIYSELPTYLL